MSVAGAATVDLRGPAVTAAMGQIRAGAIRAHVSFLADDLLEGRGTATRGHEIAARYIAAQFAAAGLEPGANGEWLQEVPLRRSDLDAAASRLEIVRPGGERTALVLARDYVMEGDFRESTDVEAPVVFAGYGITAPELKYDDYTSIDAKGKIVAFLSGGPPGLSLDARAHYSALKGETAVAHGAVGTLLLRLAGEENNERSSWDIVVRSVAGAPSFAWLDGAAPHGYLSQLRGSAWLGPSGVRALLGDDGAALAAKARPAELPLRVHILKKSRISEARSPNVVGLLRGSDPRLRDEYVVLSAHADHLGIGQPVNGDAIYNGAVDDASGVAVLLELARAFAALAERPRRSLLFVATTGEEQPGLLGSDYFVHHPPIPPIPAAQLVADLNIDGAPVWPFDSIIPRGAEHSTLARSVAAAAATAGVPVIADPFPDRLLFLGSDQYSFVQSGIPSMIAGTMGSGEARAAALQWVRTRYHAPSDDLSQPLDFAAAERFTRLLFLVGYAVAQDDDRPRWNPGDFYGERFSHRGK
jgi:hypothetical protein